METDKSPRLDNRSSAISANRHQVPRPGRSDTNEGLQFYVLKVTSFSGMTFGGANGTRRRSSRPDRPIGILAAWTTARGTTMIWSGRSTI